MQNHAMMYTAVHEKIVVPHTRCECRLGFGTWTTPTPRQSRGPSWTAWVWATQASLRCQDRYEWVFDAGELLCFGLHTPSSTFVRSKGLFCSPELYVSYHTSRCSSGPFLVSICSLPSLRGAGSSFA